MGYTLHLVDGVTYRTDDDGNVLSRSDGPQGFKYSDWRILGASKRHHSREVISLAALAAGADFGHGCVHDMDHGMHRMWASPTGRRLRSIVHTV